MTVWATNVPLNTGPFWKIYGKGAARINEIVAQFCAARSTENAGKAE